jgi:hypothetical protein
MKPPLELEIRYWDSADVRGFTCNGGLVAFDPQQANPPMRASASGF